MTYWWVDRTLPGVTDGVILAVAPYVFLHFNRKWPYWGRVGRKNRDGQH